MDQETFLSALMKNLILAKNKYPDLYAWHEVDVLEVFRRLAESMREGTYSRHMHAIKWTCKELKIPNTRESINQIFKHETEEV